MTSVNIYYDFGYPTRFTPCTACPPAPNLQECYRNLTAANWRKKRTRQTSKYDKDIAKMRYNTLIQQRRKQ